MIAYTVIIATLCTYVQNSKCKYLLLFIALLIKC